MSISASSVVRRFLAQSVVPVDKKEPQALLRKVKSMEGRLNSSASLIEANNGNVSDQKVIKGLAKFMDQMGKVGTEVVSIVDGVLERWSKMIRDLKAHEGEPWTGTFKWTETRMKPSFWESKVRFLEDYRKSLQAQVRDLKGIRKWDQTTKKTAQDLIQTTRRVMSLLADLQR